MARLYISKSLGLAFVHIFLLVCYFFTGCGMQQVADQPFDVTSPLVNFPACCAMQAAFHFMDLRSSLRARLVCCITYDKQINFIVKGPFGIELMRGLIDKKGIMVLDRLRGVVHRSDYECISRDYHFHCNYAFIQSVLLGRVVGAHKGISDPFSLTYFYDDLTGKVNGLELIDKEKRNKLKVSYRYKVLQSRTLLSRITIAYLLKDRGCYQGRMVLYKLHFKPLKKPNIRWKIPKQ